MSKDNLNNLEDFIKSKIDNNLLSPVGILLDRIEHHADFVRKLNKEGTKFEKLGGGWGKLVGPRTGSYGQN